MTKQRRAVLAELDRHSGFRSAQQVHDDLMGVGASVGLATVYRNLQALADSRQVDTLRSEAGETLYRRCTEERHHHHLVCRRCGTVAEIAPPMVEDWVNDVADEHGFSDVNHSIEIFGICPVCRHETTVVAPQGTEN